MSLLVAFGAAADPQSTPLRVRANVVTNCRIAVSDLAFGDYDPLGRNQTAELDGSANVRVLCTRSAEAALGFDDGDHGASGMRSMTGGDSARVVYELYQDPNRTREWTPDNAVYMVSAGGREAQQFTIYARIPAGQQVGSGTYTDVVRATVHF